MTPFTHTRAWQFDALGSPDVLVLRDVPLAPPGPGEARVRLCAAGVNNSDVRWIAGTYIMQPTLPAFLMQEGVGIIEAIGPHTDEPTPSGFRPQVGDRVGILYGKFDMNGMGVLREHGNYPFRALLPVPAAFSHAEGAAFWIGAATAWGALHTGGLRPADAPEKTVLVTAASSGVGTMALRIARAWGAHTRATTRSHAKAVALHPLADRVFVAESADELLAAAPDLAADVLIDPVGADYLPALIACARRDGQIVIYERISGTFATLDLKAVIGRELGVHGFTIYRFIRNAPLLRTLIEEMMHLADGGHVTPVVHQAFAFEHAPDALRALEQGEHVGKLVVTIGP